MWIHVGRLDRKGDRMSLQTSEFRTLVNRSLVFIEERLLVEKRSLPTTFGMLTADQEVRFRTQPWDSAEEREGVLMGVIQDLRTHSALGYAVFGEAWMVMRAPEDVEPVTDLSVAADRK